MSERAQIEQLVRLALQQQLSGAANQPVAGVPAKPVATSETVPITTSETVPVAMIDESVKTVITERDLQTVPNGAVLLVRANVLITPAAQDTLRERQISLRQRAAHQSRQGTQRVLALGADHGGFETKQRLIAALTAQGYATRDFGTGSTEAVDYPDFAHAVARAVADGVCDLGILIDGAGIGSCMTANKVPGVRAALCYDVATAKNSREHNYANVLTLGGKLQSAEQLSEIVNAWLATPEGEARHGKRVAKIMAIEKQYLR